MIVRVRRAHLVVLLSLVISGLNPTQTAARTSGSSITAPTRTGAPAARRASLPASDTIGSTDPVPLPAAFSAGLAQAQAALAPPVPFEPNVGQVNSAVRYLAHGPGYTLFLTNNDAELVALQAQPPVTTTAVTTGTTSLSASPRHRAAFGRLGSSGAASLTQASPPTQTTAQVLRLSYVGGNAAPQIEAQDRLTGTVNYFIGNDPSAWHPDVPTYGAVVYRGVYPGIDLSYQSQAGSLEYVWQVSPGADPSAIRLQVDGAQGLSIDGQGNLVMATALGPMEQQAPHAFQVVNGQQVNVSMQYVLQGPNQVGFSLGSYDPSLPLTIDPVLSYSTYLGGNDADSGNGIAVDPAGNAYVVGTTSSSNFITTTGAFSVSFAGTQDVFVTKLSASGNVPLYSTYLGGHLSVLGQVGQGIAVDGTGNIYVTGLTGAGDFPTTPNAFSRTYLGVSGGSNAFVVEINPNLSGVASLIYSTYLGGNCSASGSGIALDRLGNVYVTGSTGNNFPTTTNAYSGTNHGDEAFVAELTTALSGTASLVYSTYLGGSGGDRGYGIAVDGAGNAYVTGRTSSNDFPTTANAYSRIYAPNGYPASSNSFVAELSTAISGTAGLLYSTFLGGSSASGDFGTGIALDGAGTAYVTGYASSHDFPTTTNAFSRTLIGGSEAFVAKLDTTKSLTASLLYSTFLGGSSVSGDGGNGIALDAAGNAYITGITFSRDFPTTANAYSRTCGGCGSGISTAFMVKLDTAISGTVGLLYSTFLGGSGGDGGMGIALDGAGNTYVTGFTNSTDFPTVNALQSHCGDSGGGCASGDAFVTKVGATSSGAVPWHSTYQVRLSDHLQASVDLVDGHLDLHVQDMHLGARGLDLDVGHTWDSTLAQAGITSTAGQGWVSSLTPSMGGPLTGTVMFTDSSGAVWPFIFTGPATATAPFTSYFTPPGQLWALTTSSSGYTLTDLLSNRALTFDAAGRLLADTDDYANSNTLAYTSTAALPITETNSGGRLLRCYYYPTTGLLSAVQSTQSLLSGAAQGQLVAYAYTGTQLSAVTWGYHSPRPLTAQFAYSGTQLMTVTTPGGHIWQFYYDAQGRLVGLYSPPDAVTPAYKTFFFYNLTGPGSTIVAEGYGRPEQRFTGYLFDGRGQTYATVDGLGHYSYAFYDADHDPTVTVDRNFHATYYAYQYVGPSEGTGLLTQTVQQALAPTNAITNSYFYDASNRLVKSISGNGGLTYYQYDGPHHSVITTTQQLGPSGPWRGSVRGYDASGELTSYIDARGVLVPTPAPGVTPTASLSPTAALATWTWGYNALGDLTATGTPPITATLGTQYRPNLTATTLYTPDLDGNPFYQTSPNGATAVFAHDNLGRLTQTTYPPVTLYGGQVVAPSTGIGYDGDGNVITSTDGAGDLTQASYDPLGRVVALTNPVGATTLYTYSAIALLAQRDPAGNVTNFGYDAIGRRIAVTDTLGTKIRSYGYDNVGNTTAITAPLSYFYILTDTLEQRAYDPLNRAISDTIGGAGEANPTTPQTTQYSYDNDGNVLQGVSPGGALTASGYDLADRAQSSAVYTSTQASAPVASSTVSLDPADNPLDRYDNSLYDHQSSFDGANRVSQRRDCQGVCPGAGTITTAPFYDPDGNVLTMTLGGTTDYTGTYNAADWLTSQIDGADATNYGYDAAGRLRSMSLLGGAGLASNVLDPEGRATSLSETVTDTAPATTTSSSSTFSYTPNDQPLADTLGGGVLGQVRSYDADNRLTNVTSLTVTNENYNYSYDPQGRTITATLPTYNPMTATLAYNALGQITQETNTANQAVLGYWTYDGSGNLLNETALTSLYSYDYSYQALGVITPSNWLPNELYQARVSSGTFFYAYDNAGDVTTIDGGSARYQSLSYNAQGLLSGVTSTITPTGQGATSSTVAITYNARGLRDTLTITPTGQGQPAFSEHFVYRGDQVGQVNVTTPLTTFSETFLYRPDGAPLELLWRTPGQATKRYWYVVDGRHNVMGLVDNSGDGTLVDAYSYDVWGQMTVQNEGVPQPLRYGGYWWDGWDNSNATGTGGWNSGPLPWYALGARRYDPALRRFLQPDPATRGGVPDYVYANDAPLDLGDPSGQAGTPSACGRQSYVDRGATVTRCGWQALRARQEAGAQAALWAVPNLFVLDPLRNLTGATSSPVQRVLGGLALLPLVGWAGRGIGLAADVARGLLAGSDVARGSALEGLLPGFGGTELGDYTLEGRSLIAQRSLATCVAASCLMLAADRGLEIGSEYELAGQLGTTGEGAALSSIPNVLAENGIAGAEYRPGLTIEELEAAIGSGNSAIAAIHPTLPLEGLRAEGLHTVVVDAIRDGRVFIRDPLPVREGQAYSVSVSDFTSAWEGGKAVIFP